MKTVESVTENVETESRVAESPKANRVERKQWVSRVIAFSSETTPGYVEIEF